MKKLALENISESNLHLRNEKKGCSKIKAKGKQRNSGFDSSKSYLRK